MTTVAIVGAILFISVGFALFAPKLPGVSRPGDARTYLFEDGNGNKQNPFSSPPGPDDECPSCGTTVDDDFQHCSACLTPLPQVRD